MPAAVGEEAGDERQDEALPRHLPRRGGSRRRAAPQQPGRHQRRDGEELGRREQILHPAAVPHTEVVDRREHDDQRHGGEPQAELAHRHEVRRVAGEDHRDGGDDPGVHAPEHRPAPEKAGGGRPGLLQEHIDAARAGKGRRQLGADQRAEQRQHAGGQPHQQDAGNGRNLAGDLRRLHEDRGADDGADDHRRGMRQAERTLERPGLGHAAWSLLLWLGSPRPLRGIEATKRERAAGGPRIRCPGPAPRYGPRPCHRAARPAAAPASGRSRGRRSPGPASGPPG